MKPKNHTDECECPACVGEEAPKPPQQDVQWRFDPVQGQWCPRVPLAKDEQRRWSLERRLLYYVVEIERFEQRYEDLVARQTSEDRLVPIDAHLDQVLRPALRGITAALIALGGPLP